MDQVSVLQLTERKSTKSEFSFHFKSDSTYINRLEGHLVPTQCSFEVVPARTRLARLTLGLWYEAYLIFDRLLVLRARH